jgi:hypothetical protein
MQQKEDIGNRVMLCKDGKYRWIHEVNMFKNPSILFDVWKVLGITMLIVIVIVGFILVISGDLDVDGMLGMGKAMLITAAIMAVLSIIGYLVYALIAGGKYIVLFTLDEKEVVHQQMPRSAKKGQIIGDLAILAGLATGRMGTIGTGMLAKSRTSMTTTLSDVKRLTPCPRMNMIKVNETLSKNRVYVCKEDFFLVYNFLCEHCMNAKKA